MSDTQWHGEPCTVRRITAIVTDTGVFPAYWARDFAGTRRNAVEVTYAGGTFYIDDEGGFGWAKVTSGGSPHLPHSSLTIDPDTIEARPDPDADGQEPEPHLDTPTPEVDESTGGTPEVVHPDAASQVTTPPEVGALEVEAIYSIASELFMAGRTQLERVSGMRLMQLLKRSPPPATPRYEDGIKTPAEARNEIAGRS
jgi:hypothetical protein